MFASRSRTLAVGARLPRVADVAEAALTRLDLSSASTLALSLRLDLQQPNRAALAHLSRYMIMEGVSPVRVRSLQTGDSETIRIPICLLAEGTYELVCVAKDDAWASFRARESLVIDFVAG